MVDLEAVYRFLGFSDQQRLPRRDQTELDPFCYQYGHLLDPGLHSVEVETLTIITQQCTADFHNPSLTSLEFGALTHGLQ